MTLGELLEELRENILHDRSSQVPGGSGDSALLWSDKTLVRYMNQAQNKMAREGLMLRDANNDSITKFQTCVGQHEYALHPSIIAVISARCGGNPNLAAPYNKDDVSDLARAGHANFSTYYVPDRYFFNPSSLTTLNPGKIVAYGTDEFVRSDAKGSMGTMNFKVYPAPDAAHIQPIKMRVVRTPITVFKVGEWDTVSEIPEDHHLDMLTWAAYLALRIVDRDQGDAERAQEFKQQFELHVADAKKDFMRKMFANQEWGFGRNGFSYEGN